MSESRSPYKTVKSETVLWNAWRHVRSRGQRSLSEDIRRAINEFDQNAARNIRSISRRIDRGSFRFEPAAAVPKVRVGKDPRPVVIAPTESRIVQRAILEVLGGLESMRPFFSVPTSFGMRGVPVALERAFEIMEKEGGAYYLRSDVVNFFSEIPRRRVLERIAELVHDHEFNRLLDEATRVVLANEAALGDLRYLYPDDEHGVAQGGSLSALLGDVLLHDFDTALNGRGIQCLRYVDDFVLLGEKPHHVRRAFASGQDLLGKLGLQAYDPAVDHGKAEEGWTNRKWEFLGCEIHPGIIRPTRRAKQHLLQEVRRVLEVSVRTMRDPGRSAAMRQGYVQTLNRVDRVVRGWGDHYQFCNDRQGFEQLDRKLGLEIEWYEKQFFRRKEGRESGDRQRLLGVHLLLDSKRIPIVDQVHNRGRGRA